ncbi:uncharacterized protein [Watersipora subatra]|uniref:uncharacterized protein n=1 Tax=Watersipora subatra TaxID=2589382 RepID=UPI00355AD633
MSAVLSQKLPRSRPSLELDPADVEDAIARLHIGTLRKEQLRKARRSLFADDDMPPLSHHEAEALAQTETYSVTSEESYNEKRLRRRKTSGSSRDSGASSMGTESSPKTNKAKQAKSKDQQVQTSIGKNSGYDGLQAVYAAEEGTVSHAKTTDDKKTTQQHKSSRIFKIFKTDKKQTENNNTDIQMSIPMPQTFLVKYMGSRPSRGYQGAKYVESPVEEVVEAVNKLSKGSDLPLVKLEVTLDGLIMTPHKRNKVKSYEGVSIPIEYISYGSQDQNYPRIFCFIMVREMSSRSKKLDCHVYACDSSKNARKVAGCLAIAFEVYRESMEGRPAQYSAKMAPVADHWDDDMKSSYDV